MTIFETLKKARHNIRYNGSLGIVTGMEQLSNVIEQIEAGKGLEDEYEEDG